MCSNIYFLAKKRYNRAMKRCVTFDEFFDELAARYLPFLGKHEYSVDVPQKSTRSFFMPRSLLGRLFCMGLLPNMESRSLIGCCYVPSVYSSKVRTKVDGREVSSNGFFVKNATCKDPVDNRKILAICGGNCCTPTDLASTVFLMSEGQSTYDVYGVGHLADRPRTSEELCQNARTHLLRIIEAGYEPENVILSGHSLGAALLINAAHRLCRHKLADGRVLGQDANFGGLIALKTFTDLGSVIATLIVNSDPIAPKPTTIQRILAGFCNFLLWVGLVDIRTTGLWDVLPVQYKLAIAHSTDKVVGSCSNLAIARKEKSDSVIATPEKPTVRCKLPSGEYYNMAVSTGHYAWMHSEKDLVESLFAQSERSSMSYKPHTSLTQCAAQDADCDSQKLPSQSSGCSRG